MDFKGQRVKMQPGELASIASDFGLTEAQVQTVINVETSGQAYNSVGWPEFLFEPHLFYKNCPKDKLADAIKQGLAYPNWKGPGSYPKTPALRVQQFQKAAELDETAAIKSASWGLGQILGSECVEAGYTSPQEMLQAFMDSESAQVKAMLTLCHHRGIDKDMQNFPDMEACKHFALRYNGAAYAKNKYHIKLHDEYVRLAGKVKAHGTVDKANDGTIRYGDRDTEASGGPVWKMQDKFKKLGYSLTVDGKFGPGTRATILAWKANEGMDTSDVRMSPADLAMLDQAQPMPVPEERKTATVNDLKPSSTIIQKTSFGKKLLGWLTGGLSVIGIGGSSGSLLDQAQDTMDKANQAKGVVHSAKDFLGDTGITSLFAVVYEWRFAILVVVCIGAFIVFDQIQKKRLEMHQKAEIG